jgi:hypothetical protein
LAARSPARRSTLRRLSTGTIVAHAELNRLLDGEIHLVAGLQRLDQRDARATHARHPASRQLGVDPIALDALDVRRILAATTVEQDHRRPRRQAQHAHGMARHRLRQFDVGARREASRQ